jgi:hypothetical protein
MIVLILVLKNEVKVKMKSKFIYILHAKIINNGGEETLRPPLLRSKTPINPAK